MSKVRFSIKKEKKKNERKRKKKKNYHHLQSSKKKSKIKLNVLLLTNCERMRVRSERKKEGK